MKTHLSVELWGKHKIYTVHPKIKSKDVDKVVPKQISKNIKLIMDSLISKNKSQHFVKCQFKLHNITNQMTNKMQLLNEQKKTEIQNLRRKKFNFLKVILTYKN